MTAGNQQAVVSLPNQPHAHVWVSAGKVTAVVITGAPEGTSMDASDLFVLIFPTGWMVTITEVGS